MCYRKPWKLWSQEHVVLDPVKEWLLGQPFAKKKKYWLGGDRELKGFPLKKDNKSMEDMLASESELLPDWTWRLGHFFERIAQSCSWCQKAFAEGEGGGQQTALSQGDHPGQSPFSSDPTFIKNGLPVGRQRRAFGSESKLVPRGAPWKGCCCQPGDEVEILEQDWERG